MKTIYLFLLVSFSTFANNPKNENPKPSRESIAGLKIVSYDSQKNGKHIYVISDMYTKKKITIYNNEGEKVYFIKTAGSAIYLSKFKKGKYTVKIVEGKKQEIKEYIIE